MTRGRVVAAALLVVATVVDASSSVQRAVDVTCASNIVSATTVASLCAHVEGNEQRLDLLILWRGRPGWFQRRAGAKEGMSGNAEYGGGARSQVSQRPTYGGVTLAFDADFASGFADVDHEPVELKEVNAVFVDRVDAAERSIVTRLKVDPRLPLSADPHVAIARASNTVLAFLQCEVPMPTANMPQAAVRTVCDSLRSR